MKHLLSLLIGRRAFRLFYLGGLLLLLTALWQMGKTARFVWGAEVIPAQVTDVRQMPFESTLDALLSGNCAWAGDISYIPTLRFTLPCGIRCVREIPAAVSAEDYIIGSSTDILTYSHDPTSARPYRFKALWGGDLFRLFGGILLLLTGRLLQGRRQTRRPRTAAKKPERPAQQPAAPRQEAPAEPKKRSRRKKTATEGTGDAPAADKPRRRRKKKQAETA